MLSMNIEHKEKLSLPKVIQMHETQFNSTTLLHDNNDRM